MRGLIIGAGNPLDDRRLELLIDKSDFVVCADGGMDLLFRIRRLPNLIVGDLDSISQETLNYVKDKDVPIEKFPVMKDSTDTELAIEYLIEKDCKHITLTGVTGTRLDHTLANIYLLNYIMEKGLIGKIVDNHNTIYLLDQDFEIHKEKDKYISLLPICPQGINISLSGFLYNLNRKDIKFASSQGISNRVTEERAHINIHSGKALLFISGD